MPSKMKSDTTFSEEAIPAAPKKKVTKKVAKVASKKSPAPGPSALNQEILFKGFASSADQATSPYILIDHPQEKEILMGSMYTIRLGVGEATSVEISLNNEPSQPCRFSDGFWWFDWFNIAPGKHTLVARVRLSDGRVLRTPVRSCTYRP